VEEEMNEQWKTMTTLCRNVTKLFFVFGKTKEIANFLPPHTLTTERTLAINIALMIKRLTKYTLLASRSS